MGMNTPLKTKIKIESDGCNTQSWMKRFIIHFKIPVFLNGGREQWIVIDPSKSNHILTFASFKLSFLKLSMHCRRNLITIIRGNFNLSSTVLLLYSLIKIKCIMEGAYEKPHPGTKIYSVTE